MERSWRFAAGIVGCTGVAVLIGWYTGVAALSTVIPGYVAMKPNTALSLILLSVALLTRRRPVALLLGGAPAVLGGATLLEWVTDRSLGIDRLLPGIDLGAQTARMAPATSVALLLLGTALAFGGGRTAALRSLALTSFAVGYVAILGYFYGVSSLYTVGGYTSMAVHTAVCICLLSLAILLREPGLGLVGLLRDRGSAGELMRPMVPFLFLGPAALGGLRLWAQELGWFDTAFGVGVLVTSMTILGSALTWHSALRLRDLDRQRDQAQQSLLEANHGLEQTVRQRTAEAAATAQRLSALIQLAPVAIIELDASGGLQTVNEQWTTLSGLTQQQSSGAGWAAAVHPDDVERVSVGWAANVADGASYETTLRLVAPDGRISWVHTRTAALRDHAVLTGHLATVTDVTVLRAAQEAAAAAQARFRSAFASSPLGTAIVSFDGLIIDANRKLGELLAQPVHTLQGFSMQGALHPEEPGGADDWLPRLLDGSLACHRMERQLRSDSATPVWVDVSIAVINDGESQEGLLYELEDVTARRLAEARVEHLALHDPLTDLPNRVLLVDRLGQALQHAARNGRGVGVLFIDLDRFKVVNDSLGHHAGDTVLTEIAHRLRASARATDTVSRMGGDEFVVVCPDIGSSGDLLPIAAHLQAAIAKPISIGDQYASVDSSIGIAFGIGHDDPDLLLRNADQAMYLAKGEGRGRYEVFDDNLRRRIQHGLDTQIALKGAVERNEIVTWYQPIVELQHQSVMATEALVRWHRPGRPLVLPNAFIAIAEDVGLIKEIGATVLNQACLAAAALEGGTAVTVNVSAHQFVREDFGATVEAALALSGLPPHRLWLELTESAVVQAVDSAARTFQRLRSQGIRIAIDDFGTGYSSFEHLRNFTVDLLKIDRVFIRDLERSEHDRAIVAGILRLADSLDLDVVAEGIETTAQRDLLRDMGCLLGQGYLFARPSPVITPVTLVPPALPLPRHRRDQTLAP